MPTNTTNYGLYKPLVNNATDQDLWGGYLNTDMDSIDGLIKTAMNWTASSQNAAFSVTAPTSGSATTGSAKLFYLCDLSSAGFAATLPAASTASGLTVGFKKTDSSTNSLTITGAGSDKIDGSATLTLSAQYSEAVIFCDGTNWNIIGVNAPSKTEMQTPASTVKAVTPAQMQNHPGVAKAWILFTDAGGGSPILVSSYNVASIASSGSGSYRVTFTTAFADSNYILNATGSVNASATAYILGALKNGGTKSTTQCDVQFVIPATNAAASATVGMITFFGTQ